jgi:hypothetical protein
MVKKMVRNITPGEKSAARVVIPSGKKVETIQMDAKNSDTTITAMVKQMMPSCFVKLPADFLLSFILSSAFSV